MKSGIALISLVLITLLSTAQTPQERRAIDTYGHAEIELTPDEIYIMIHMVERYEGKEKLTIEKQEQQLLAEIEKRGLPTDQMVVAGGNASYVRIPWKTKKDVLASVNYEIMVKSADEAAKVFEAVDALDLNTCRIGRVDHSQRNEYERQMRKNAMADAAQKADDMLGVIGSKRGAPIFVREENAPHARPLIAQYERYDAVTSFEAKVSTGFDVSFKKILITSDVYVKFEVE